MSYEDSIILLGPMHIGKSTMAIRILQKYFLEFVNCDNLFDYYYRKENYEKNYFSNLLDEKGFEECCKITDTVLFKFSKEILEMVREIGAMSIIDFGGNHIAYKDNNLNNLMIKQLIEFKNVIILMPYEDKQKSFDYFRKIFSDPLKIKLNEYIYECLTELVPMFKTIYVNGQSEDELFEQIDDYINRNIKLERGKTPTLEKTNQKMKISNKYFPNVYNI